MRWDDFSSESKLMKAWQLSEPKRFLRVDIEEPGEPGKGCVLVRTHAMGICGTDISCYLGKFPFFAYPRIPGHELGVEVLAVGEGVKGLKAGDRCSVEPYLHCGNCYACRRGATNCCVNLKVIGVMMDGGLCDRFVLPATKLHVSNRLDFEQLALVETLAIGCRAVNRAELVSGEPLLIIGAGPIGLASLEFGLLAGASVTVMDVSASRLEFVQRYYPAATTVLGGTEEENLAQARSLTSGDLFPQVIDATGNCLSMSNAPGFVAPTGNLVYVGITTDLISFRHPVFHRPEMTLKASRNALPEDFTRIVRLMENGSITTGHWITGRTEFENVGNEFESYMDPLSGTVKGMIRVQG